MNRQFLSLTSLTITHLKQVIDKMVSLKQQELVRLDQTVNSYLFKRKQSKPQLPATEQSFQSCIRSQLIYLEQKNDYLLKEADIMHRSYLSQKIQMAKSNQLCLKQQQEIAGNNDYEDLIKELLMQLSPFKKIADYVERLQTLRRESMDKEIMTLNAQEYFQKIDQIMGQGEEEEHYHDFQTHYY